LTGLLPNCNASGTLAAVLATVTPESCKANTLKSVIDRRRRHGEENRLHPEREEAERQSKRRRGDELYLRFVPAE
jgi:hypothetical protein